MKKHTLTATAAMVMSVATTMAAEYHVSPSGNNVNPGSSNKPLRTIQAAADKAMPGDVITVHAGVYRERITPPRGGSSEAKRIVYRVAPGEKVTLTGSEPMKGWEKVKHDTWKVTVKNAFFGDFNPYADLIRGAWFRPQGRKHHTGSVYLNGHWLIEAASLPAVMKPAGANPMWFAQVDKGSTPDAGTTTIWAQFPKVDPNKADVEINVRQTVFTPAKTGINYITLRGFDIRNGATPWAPPTSGQIGLVSAYWCKGWIIENNEIAYSKCAGVALGKYSDEWDFRAQSSADGYVGTIKRAVAKGWDKSIVGSHIVRNNHIHHCDQVGVVGSLGGVFSKITGNEIHDIHTHNRFDGAELAGIKLHGGIDVEISDNHIYRCSIFGIWLDWMTQGARVTGNLLHDNKGRVKYGQDIYFEVNHGPFLMDNNLLLSRRSFHTRSRGGAFAHNLYAGEFWIYRDDKRQTPYHKAHSTELAGYHANPGGGDRYHNNLLAGKASLEGYNQCPLPSVMSHNVFVHGAKASKFDQNALVVADFNPGIKLEQKADGWYLSMKTDPGWAKTQQRPLVTTELLGIAKIPKQAFENPDGSPIRIDRDYFGRPRHADNPFPGPFAGAVSGEIKVWPKSKTPSK